MIELKRFFIGSIFLLTAFLQGDPQSFKNETIEENPITEIQEMNTSEQTNLGGSEEDMLCAIRPEVRLPYHTSFYVTIVFLSLFLLLIFLLLIKKLRNKQTTPILIPLSPYTKALQGLDVALGYIHQKDKKPFAFGITDSVRYYLSEVFNLPAPESTTEEVLEKLKDVNDLNEPLKNTINTLLKMCDLAKFTQQAFDYEMRLELYYKAKEIIQEADKCWQQKRVANTIQEESHANV